MRGALALLRCTYCLGLCRVLTVVHVEPRFALCVLCWAISGGFRP